MREWITSIDYASWNMIICSYKKIDTEVSKHFADIIRSYDFYFNEERALSSLLKFIDSFNRDVVVWDKYFNNALDSVCMRFISIPADRMKTYSIIFYSKEFSKLQYHLECINKSTTDHEISLVTKYFIESLNIIKSPFIRFNNFPLIRTDEIENKSYTNKIINLITKIYRENKDIFDNFLIMDKLISPENTYITLSDFISQLSKVSFDNKRDIEKFLSDDNNKNIIRYCMQQDIDTISLIANNPKYSFSVRTNIVKIKDIILLIESTRSSIVDYYKQEIQISRDFIPEKMQEKDLTVEAILFKVPYDPFRSIISSVYNRDFPTRAQTGIGRVLIQKIKSKRIDLFQYEQDPYRVLNILKIQEIDYNYLSTCMAVNYDIENLTIGDEVVYGNHKFVPKLRKFSFIGLFKTKERILPPELIAQYGDISSGCRDLLFSLHKRKRLLNRMFLESKCTEAMMRKFGNLYSKLANEIADLERLIDDLNLSRKDLMSLKDERFDAIKSHKLKKGKTSIADIEERREIAIHNIKVQEKDRLFRQNLYR